VPVSTIKILINFNATYPKDRQAEKPWLPGMAPGQLQNFMSKIKNYA